ncbi:MAG: methyltransferase domain-containing protein [Chloroflexi bacterium]|nr:methyltransferase domain-containing protein [Chloroflexota bacterium]
MTSQIMIDSTSLFDENYQYFRQIARAGKFSVPWWSARFYAQMARRYAPRASARRVLDVGCAFGWVLKNLDNDFETYGIDIADYAIRVAREHSPRSQLRVGDASALREYPDAHFDVITSKHVFEHLANPGETLKECARLLKRGGVLIFGTPNADNPLKKLKGAQWIGVKDASHISVLPPAEWLALTRAAGLQITHAFSDGFWDVPYLPRLPALLQLPLFAMPAALQVLIGLPFLPVKWGESLIVVARKE